MKDIILLHGAIGAPDQLDALATALRQHEFRPHTFGFSGHGQQPFGVDFGIAAFAGELQEYIGQHHFENPLVFGYSMGGYVALYLASRNPGLLGHIVTLGTKFAWSPESAAREAAMLNPATILEKVPKFAAALEARHGKDWQQLLHKTADMITELGNKPLIHDEALSGIGNKVLVGLADQDTMVSVEETRRAFLQLKQGQMYMLPGSKHPIETANTALLAGIIQAFSEH